MRVGDQEIGISGYDTIMRKAQELEGASDDEVKSIILRELKIFNYIPRPIETEYLDAMWREFRKMKEERRRLRQQELGQ